MSVIISLIWYDLWPWSLYAIAVGLSCFILAAAEYFTRNRLLALAGHRIVFAVARRKASGIRWLAAWTRLVALYHWLMGRTYSMSVVPKWAVLVCEAVIGELPLPELAGEQARNRRALVVRILRDIYAPAPSRLLRSRCGIDNACGSRGLFFAAELAWTTGDDAEFARFRNRLQQEQHCPVNAVPAILADRTMSLLLSDPVATSAEVKQYAIDLSKDLPSQALSSWPNWVQQCMPLLRFHWHRRDYLALVAAGHCLIEQTAKRSAAEHSVVTDIGQTVDACRDVYALLTVAYQELASESTRGKLDTRTPSVYFYRMVANDLAAIANSAGVSMFVSSIDEELQENLP